MGCFVHPGMEQCSALKEIMRLFQVVSWKPMHIQLISFCFFWGSQIGHHIITNIADVVQNNSLQVAKKPEQIMVQDYCLCQLFGSFGALYTWGTLPYHLQQCSAYYCLMLSLEPNIRASFAVFYVQYLCQI